MLFKQSQLRGFDFLLVESDGVRQQGGLWLAKKTYHSILIG